MSIQSQHVDTVPRDRCVAFLIQVVHDQCCNFYLEDECVAECPSPLVNDSNYDCGGSIIIIIDNCTIYTTLHFKSLSQYSA